MLHRFSRSELLLGTENIKKLAQTKVAIFGIGGVGSFVAEGLARGGIGNFVLIDSDDISLTNINRQIHALENTIGQKKTLVMKQRILSINPQAQIQTIEQLYTPENADLFWQDDYDYVIDAIDDIKGKIDLAVQAEKHHIPIISSMGTANKLDPQKFVITDITKTHTCPLARIMRKALKQKGIKHLKVLFSTEEPHKNYSINFTENTSTDTHPAASRKQPLGTLSFVPSIAGLLIAGEVIKDICNINE
ncbi:tRNA threonylcarbamoyladenosine dehydratase [Megamonas hypermegale]|uniref:tRNA threonylcarbamoyladenosine dehydratase n=1 Tax=Megamonas hypermegale TaxID=158847 RepID=UPI00242D06D6|nr:tRNA threonylcarbamoyladenosine dehydratase [Megamonas hypermegale]